MYKLTPPPLLISGIALLACLHFPTASSAPVITAVSAAGTPPRVSITWSAIGPGSTSVIPCPAPSCYYGIFAYYNQSPGGAQTSYDYFGRSLKVRVARGTTWGQAASDFTARFGASGSSSWQWSWRPSIWDICVGATPGVVGKETPMLERPSSCTVVPPSGTTCNVTGNITINHGLLSASNVAGHSAASQGVLTCSQKATLRLRILPSVIDLGGGWSSSVQINGVSDGGSVTTEGSTNLSFVSQLSGDGETRGVHSGSSIVIFDIL